MAKAVNKDDKNFCSLYAAVPELGFTGPWRMVINIVADADPRARARIEDLIPAGAPVEWRTVKYSCAQLTRIQDVLIREQLLGGFALSIGIDPIANAVSLTTFGSQPDLAAQLEQLYGDEVVVVEGPAGSPQPI